MTVRIQGDDGMGRAEVNLGFERGQRVVLARGEPCAEHVTIAACTFMASSSVGPSRAISVTVRWLCRQR